MKPLNIIDTMNVVTIDLLSLKGKFSKFRRLKLLQADGPITVAVPSPVSVGTPGGLSDGFRLDPDACFITLLPSLVEESMVENSWHGSHLNTRKGNN